MVVNMILELVFQLPRAPVALLSWCPEHQACVGSQFLADISGHHVTTASSRYAVSGDIPRFFPV